MGEATSGQEALTLVSERDPDVVLMDLVMPVMGGMEAAVQIRRYHSFKRLPIIAMTRASRGAR